MNNQKPTPGPWVAVPDWTYDRLEIRDKDGWRIAICTKDFPMSTATHDGNAYLLAAAPDMLAALEDAKKFIEDHLPFGRYCTVEDFKSRVNKVMLPIEAAIRKAKGCTK